jgi:hypothetical protein
MTGVAIKLEGLVPVVADVAFQVYKVAVVRIGFEVFGSLRHCGVGLMALKAPHHLDGFLWSVAVTTFTGNMMGSVAVSEGGGCRRGGGYGECAEHDSGGAERPAHRNSTGWKPVLGRIHGTSHPFQWVGSLLVLNGIISLHDSTPATAVKFFFFEPEAWAGG